MLLHFIIDMELNIGSLVKASLSHFVWTLSDVLLGYLDASMLATLGLEGDARNTKRLGYMYHDRYPTRC